jgi:CBS domain-containing protein/mannitol/fructose-specific phosphotransferase system IIA component (Ntr-type)
MKNLADLLAADRVIVPLDADTLPAAADALLERLVAAGSVADPARLRERLDEARPEDIVAMGDRAFLLHYRTDTVRDLAVALGTRPRPICRELGDGDRQCARILLLVVAPPRQATRYLQVVGAFARFLSSAERVDAVLAQPTAEALLGLPSLADYELREELTVGDLMTRNPRSVSPETPLREAARDMVRAGVGGMPVVEAGGQVIGMLTERDLMRHLLGSYLHRATAPRGGREAGAPADRTGGDVRDAMTRQVLCVSPEQPLAEVAALMTNKDVDRLPVVRDGGLVGFITRGDIVRKLIGS